MPDILPSVLMRTRSMSWEPDINAKTACYKARKVDHKQQGEILKTKQYIEHYPL